MNPSAAELSLSLFYANAKLHLVLDEALGANHGISFEDVALLNSLKDEGGASLKALSQTMGVSRSVLLQRTRPLEKIGLVNSEGSVADRRTLLTPAGHRTLRSALESVGDAVNDFLKPQEVTNLLKTLAPVL